MYCQNCGQEILPDASFCSACGKSVAAVPEVAAVESETANVYRAPKATGYREEGFGGEYAGFWRRLGAYMIDYLLIGVAMVIVLAVVGIGATVGGQSSPAASAALVVILEFVGPWLYFALMESSEGQATLGKKLLRLRVCDLDGGRISFGRATGRFFGKILSGMLFCIGFLMVAFTERKQGLHDMMAGTLVVDRDGVPEGGERMPVKRMSTGAIVAIVLAAGFIPFMGILAAIAIPAYADYTSRAKLSRAVAAVTPAETAMAEYYVAHGEIPSGFDLARDAGYTFTSPYVSEVKVRDADAAIEVTLNLPAIQGKTLLFVPSLAEGSRLTWKCGSPDIASKYLPQSCREHLE